MHTQPDPQGSRTSTINHRPTAASEHRAARGWCRLPRTAGHDDGQNMPSECHCSEGCRNRYAERMPLRLGAVGLRDRLGDAFAGDHRGTTLAAVGMSRSQVARVIRRDAVERHRSIRGRFASVAGHAASAGGSSPHGVRERPTRRRSPGHLNAAQFPPRPRVGGAGAMLAETEGFEPSRRFPAYSLSRGAPSTTRPRLRAPTIAVKHRGGNTKRLGLALTGPVGWSALCWFVMPGR